MFFITNECLLLYENLELYSKQTTASEPDFYSLKSVVVLQTTVIPLCRIAQRIWKERSTVQVDV